MPNEGDIIVQKFVKKPKNTRTINENIEVDGDFSVNGNISVNGNNIDDLYYKKTGGTISGNATVSNNFYSGKLDGSTDFQLKGNANSFLYWKEHNYGDKFKLVPSFGGTDDDNKLKIQGAVGGAGTDPAFYDLMTISGKNGNVWLKGELEAKTINLKNNSGDVYFNAERTDTGVKIGFGIGSGGTNHGIWSYKLNRWLLYGTANETVLPKIVYISGTAQEQPLRVRGIVGSNADGTAVDELHIGYGSDYATKFGKNATTYIQASGMIRGTQAGSWVKDRDNSLVRNSYNSNGAYAPVICQGTKSGTWTVGCLSGEDKLTFNYETDTKYNNNTNTDQRVTIDTNGNYSGKALNVTEKKSLSSVTNIGYGTNNGYCVDVSAIAYWNGAYSGTSSNLQYSSKGKIPRMRSSAQIVYKRQSYSSSAWGSTNLVASSSKTVGSDFVISGNAIKVNNSNVNRVKVTLSISGARAGTGTDLYFNVIANGVQTDAYYKSYNSSYGYWASGGSMTFIADVSNGSTIYARGGTGVATTFEPLNTILVVEDVSVW